MYLGVSGCGVVCQCWYMYLGGNVCCVSVGKEALVLEAVLCQCWYMY